MLKLYVRQSNANTIVATWEGEGTLKHEIINDDYVTKVVSKIKNRNPNTIEFSSVELEDAFMQELAKHEIYINARGKIFYDKSTIYNEIDKSIESSNTFDLVVSHAYNNVLAKILEESGYTFEMHKLENNKVRFIING